MLSSARAVLSGDRLSEVVTLTETARFKGPLGVCLYGQSKTVNDGKKQISFVSGVILQHL